MRKNFSGRPARWADGPSGPLSAFQMLRESGAPDQCLFGLFAEVWIGSTSRVNCLIGTYTESLEILARDCDDEPSDRKTAECGTRPKSRLFVSRNQ